MSPSPRTMARDADSGYGRGIRLVATGDESHLGTSRRESLAPPMSRPTWFGWLALVIVAIYVVTVVAAIANVLGWVAR